MLGQWNTFSKAIRPLSRWNEWFDDNHEGMQMGIFLSFPSLFSLSFYPSREISFDRAEESRIPFLFFFHSKNWNYETTEQQKFYRSIYLRIEIFDLNCKKEKNPIFLTLHFTRFLHATINERNMSYRSRGKRKNPIISA